MSKSLIVVLFAASFVVGCARPDRGVSGMAPVLTRTIVLPGVNNSRPTANVRGRIDHLRYDPATDRLFIAALENGSLEVVDLAKGERIHSIGGLVQPQGVEIAAAEGRAAVACGGDGVVHVYDTRTLEETAAIQVGRGSDNVRYDSNAHEIYATYGNKNGGGIAVIDARKWEKVRDIPLRSRPESFQLDPNGPRIFANMPGGLRAVNDGTVAIIDRKTGEVVMEIPLPQRARNYPMAFDPEHERLFIASRRPPRLILVDTRNNALVGEAVCMDDSDDLFYDARTGRVLVIGGGFRPDFEDTPPEPGGAHRDETGALDVFTVGDDGTMIKVASTPTVHHARTGLFVPERRAIYLAVPTLEGRDSEIREYRVAD